MDATAQAILWGQIRTAVAVISGILMAHGFISGTTATEVLGALTVLYPIFSSAWAHIQAEKIAKAREVVAVNVGVVATVAGAVAAPVPPEAVPEILKAFAPVAIATTPAAAPLKGTP